MSLLFLKQFTLLTFFFLWPFHYSIYGSFTTYKTQTFLIKHLSSRKRVFISLMNKITLIQFIKLKIKPINVLWVFDAVCFISHVIQHCNVFSPCILKYVLSLDFNCLLGFGIAVFSPPSCLPDLHQALSFGRCFETNVFRGEVSLSITAVPNSTTKCSELEGTTKDHGVQFWSTTNLQILEDPNAGMSWAAAQCVQPALHSSHGTKHAIKSKSLLAAWSPWGLTQPPLWLLLWQGGTCWGISALPKGSYTSLQDEPTHSSELAAAWVLGVMLLACLILIFSLCQSHYFEAFFWKKINHKKLWSLV